MKEELKEVKEAQLLPRAVDGQPRPKLDLRQMGRFFDVLKDGQAGVLGIVAYEEKKGLHEMRERLTYDNKRIYRKGGSSYMHNPIIIYEDKGKELFGSYFHVRLVFDQEEGVESLFENHYHDYMDRRLVLELFDTALLEMKDLYDQDILWAGFSIEVNDRDHQRMFIDRALGHNYDVKTSPERLVFTYGKQGQRADGAFFDLDPRTVNARLIKDTKKMIASKKQC